MPDPVAIRTPTKDTLRAHTASGHMRVEEDLQVASALARAGQELLAALETPAFLDRLCQVTAEQLECDSSQTLLWRPDEDVFVLAAGFGARPEEREVRRTVKVPRASISGLLSELQCDDVAQVGTVPPDVLSKPLLEQLGVTVSLCMALRRSKQIIGLQVALARERPQPFTHAQRRIARGIAQLASAALAHVWTVEELTKASQLKSDFVATMSHELRTPLHVIIGYTDLVLEGDFGTLTPEQSNCLERVRERVRELIEVVGATQDLSRLGVGRVPAAMQPVSLTELMEQVRTETQALQARAHGRFVWNIAADLPLLFTDPVKVKVVLKNLISNAVKFTDAGSITLDAYVRDGGVEISVADTGCGIASEALPIIFEPFTHAESLPARRTGVGLGLYVVRQLLGDLGGTVCVASELGSGSTFRVRLPLCRDKGLPPA